MMLTIVIVATVTAARLSDAVGETQAGAGHMQRIGNQAPIIRGEIAEFDTMISGYSFYRDFFIPGVPAVFRGLLKDNEMMRNIANQTFMKNNFGSVHGEVDHRKNWTRGGTEFVPRSMMNFSDFLDRFEKEDLYWDDMIPANHTVLKSLPFPLALNCEESRATIQYINLMVNSGMVSYIFHSDNADNIYHLISGEKTWLIANSSSADKAYIDEINQRPGFSPVAPDAVDLIRFPKMSELELHEVKIKPGDVLYIPRKWPHYVRSYGSPNIALNIWFGGEPLISLLPNELNCKKQRRSAKDIFTNDKAEI